MRMWMLNPKLLCNKHLLGEHGEIHKFRHIFEKGHSIHGGLFPVTQIEPRNMKERHDQLAEELIRRGFNHNSPYIQPSLHHYHGVEQFPRVNRRTSHEELSLRCTECRNLLLRKVVI